jgi:hypothetical protein
MNRLMLRAVLVLLLVVAAAGTAVAGGETGNGGPAPTFVTSR